MSDFGAIIYISRNDGNPIDAEAFGKISEGCATFAADAKFTSSLGEPFLFQVGKTTNIEGVIKRVNLLLSDYWGDQSDFEWNREVDEKNAKRIASELTDLFPGYRVAPSFEWW